MKLSVFCIYDAVVAAFGTPFCCLTEGHAKRTLIDSCQNRGRAGDFTLYHLGVYDTENGLHDVFAVPFQVVRLDALQSEKDF